MMADGNVLIKIIGEDGVSVKVDQIGKTAEATEKKVEKLKAGMVKLAKAGAAGGAA